MISRSATRRPSTILADDRDERLFGKEPKTERMADGTKIRKNRDGGWEPVPTERKPGEHNDPRGHRIFEGEWPEGEE
jgi:hypothetical protein